MTVYANAGVAEEGERMNAGLLTNFLGHLHYEPIFITYAALIVMAIIPIYFGSKQAVEESEVI